MVHGLLLTGGASSRMGEPKAAICFHGVSLATRAARALKSIADPVLAVGPAFDTELDAVGDPGHGPLAAFVAGADVLRSRRCASVIVMAACDLPFIDTDVVRFVVGSLGGHDAAVPVVGERDQPSISCFSAHAVEEARALVAKGERSMRAWLAVLDVIRLTDADWRDVATTAAFTDVDTPEELERARALIRVR